MKLLHLLCVVVAIVMAFLLGLLVGQQLVVAHPAPPAAATESAPLLSSPTVTTAATLPSSPTDNVRLSVEPLCQHPAYPTGCEVVAATMALRYVGVAAEVEELLPHLPTSRNWYWYNGVFYGPDPAVHFCGDPRSKQSYGCFAPVVRAMLTAFLGDDCRVVDADGQTLPRLCRRYIDSDLPVLVWGTLGMAPVTAGRSWILPDGRRFVWPAGEHCLLLVGYDEERYYFNDPDTGRQVAYPKEQAEQRYEELGRQAVVILP
ncbi:MAG: C39 family peptidase [Clostridia bacterium]|nr:C39 family peptidase [Clostridia bacterium]